MRHETSHEQRGRHSTNGSSQNGSSEHTNGTTNGYHDDTQEEHEITHDESSFYGHNREEITRILLQSLSDLGYREAANQLSKESGYQVEVPSVAAFRSAVLLGEWEEAEALLFGTDYTEDGGVRLENGQPYSQWQKGRAKMNGYEKHGLPLAEGADTIALRFLLRQQKYLELLEARDLGSALHVLRNELTPLKRDVARLHALSSLMMCSSATDLQVRSQWNGAHGDSRSQLLTNISTHISPSVMIPEHRLATLLNAVQEEQVQRCKYHNTTVKPSLYTDHECAIEDLPLQTLTELKHHMDEVWTIDFSHDGSLLATAGKEGVVIIYDTLRWKVLHELRDYERNTISAQNRGVCQIAFSPDDRYLVTCSLNHDFTVFNTGDARIVARGDHFDYPVCAVAWLPDSESFVIGSQSALKPLSMYSMRSSATGSSFAVIKNNEIFSWRDPLTGFKSKDHSSALRVTALAVSPDGTTMAASTTDNRLITFDLDTKERKAEWPMDGQITWVAFSKDGESLLINMFEDTVQALDSTSGEVITEYKGVRQRCWALKSCFGGADDSFVLSGSEDSTIMMWRRHNGAEVATLAAHSGHSVNAVAWHPTNPAVFASAGDDRRVRIWTSTNALRSHATDSSITGTGGLYS